MRKSFKYKVNDRVFVALKNIAISGIITRRFHEKELGTEYYKVKFDVYNHMNYPVYRLGLTYQEALENSKNFDKSLGEENE